MSADLDAWVVGSRPPRETLHPHLPYEYFVEEERSANGEVVPIATVFITNKECPFRCVMCDLWRNTLTERVPVGAIPAQIDHALGELRSARQLKLYNSGSFFDRQAIPSEDYGAIAERANRFERLIVENHPALVGDACLRFRDLLGCRLEVAMGLETAHPETLARLNKRMTLKQFSRAAAWLHRNQIDLRVFILVQPPYMPAAQALYWAERSLDFAMEQGATAAVLIPTRGGNGAMEALQARGEYAPPALATLEAAMEYGLGRNRLWKKPQTASEVSTRAKAPNLIAQGLSGFENPLNRTEVRGYTVTSVLPQPVRAGRVFADLWGLRERCAECHAQRCARLRQMNLEQVVLDRISCARCCGAS